MAGEHDPTKASAAEQEARHAQAAANGRSNRNVQILAGTVFAALVAVVLIVVISGGSGPKPPPDPGKTGAVAGIPNTKTLLAGIPQNGYTLGDPKAPLNLIEFLDVQCPFCKAHQLDEQPTVIKDAVRTGKATLTMQPVAAIGPDSAKGRIVLTKLAAQNHAWDFLNLWYWNQQTENTGYVTPKFLSTLVQATPSGTAGDATLAESPAVSTQLASVDALQKALKVRSVPTFALGRSDAAYATYSIVDAHKTTKPAGEELVDAINAALHAKS